MSLPRLIVLVFGIVYVIVGVIGFIPSISPDIQPANMPSSTGAVLGIFPINLLHNVVHILIGAALLYGSTSTANAVNMARGVGILYLVVGLLGFFAPDTFGLMPIGGADIGLHFASAAVLLITGFLLPAADDRDTRLA